MPFIVMLATVAIAQDPGPRPTDERFRQLASAKVSSFLADPEAARFKWDAAITDQGGAKPLFGKRAVGWWTCGLVNAKNQMGGYVGYRRFIAVVRDDHVVYTNTSEGAGDFADDLCERAIKQGTLSPRSSPIASVETPQPK